MISKIGTAIWIILIIDAIVKAILLGKPAEPICPTQTSKTCGCTSSTYCNHKVEYCEYGSWKLSVNDHPKTCYNTSAACDSTQNTYHNFKESCSCSTTTSCSWGTESSSDVSSCSSSHPSCTSGATDVSCSDIKYSCPSGGSLSGTACYYSG